MIRQTTRSVLILFVLIFGACSNSLLDKTDFGSIPSGAYRYLGFDSSERLIVKGWLRFNPINPAGFDGDWHLEAVGNPQNIGPQIGDGHLNGRIENGVTVIDLNPNFRDNNVTLSGELHTDSYSGRWTWSGIRGPISEGRFEAKRR